MRLRTLSIGLLALICCPLFAQQESGTQQQLEPRTAKGAGFVLNYNGLFSPFVTETSNAVVYGFLLQRDSIAGGIYVHDSVMPLARFTQTLMPLSQVGTVEQLLESTITDATNSLKGLLGKPDFELPTAVECTRLIAGIERKGNTYPIDLEGTAGVVECYAFEDASGKGVGVILKYRQEPDEATDIDESELLSDILEDLTIIPLEKTDPYTVLIAGYPITLPVLSRVDSVKQLNEHAVEAAVTLENASMNIQLMRIPEGYSVGDTLVNHLAQYESMLDEQAASGQFQILWRADSSIPAGTDRTGLVDAKVTLIEANGSTVYNSLYSVIDDQIILVANLTAPLQHAKSVSQTAQIMFRNPNAGLTRRTTLYHLPGHQLMLPAGYRSWTSKEPSDAGTLYVAPYYAMNLDDLKENAFSGSSYTRLQAVPRDDSGALARVHQELCDEELNRHSTSNSAEKPDQQEPISDQLTLEDGRVVDRLISRFVPTLSETKLAHPSSAHPEMVVTSYEFVENPEQPRLIISSIARNAVEFDAQAISEALLGKVSTDPTPSQIELPFGSVRLEPMRSNGYSYSNNYDELGTVLHVDNVLINVSTSSEDDQYQVLSNRMLAEKFIKNEAWEYNTFTSERELYPGDHGGLVDVTFAGYPAVMCQAKLLPPEPWSVGNRVEPTLLRIYGFLHGNRYSTVIFKQTGRLDSDHLDRIASDFIGNSDPID